MDSRLDKIREKRPEQLTVADLAYLIGQIDSLEAARTAAREMTERAGNCILRYADGYMRPYTDVGTALGHPIREIRFVIQKYPISMRPVFDDATSADIQATYKERVFRLDGFRGWDRMPIYREVVE